jgi:hypothetical protein
MDSLVIGTDGEQGFIDFARASFFLFFAYRIFRPIFIYLKKSLDFFTYL